MGNVLLAGVRGQMKEEEREIERVRKRTNLKHRRKVVITIYTKISYLL